MASLAPLRADLLRGDRRILYLGWLLAAQEGVLSDNTLEPSPPVGLADLSAPLLAFLDFMGIDRDLVEAAACGNDQSAPKGLSREAIVSGIHALPDAEKTALLMRLVSGEETHMEPELLQRLEADAGLDASSSPATGHRTVGELLVLAESITAEKQQRAAKREATERARRERKDAESRKKHLDQLAARESEAWREVDHLIASRKPGEYDQAVAILVDLDLRDLAIRSKNTGLFQARVSAIREEHRRKSSLITRLDKAGVTGQN